MRWFEHKMSRIRRDRLPAKHSTAIELQTKLANQKSTKHKRKTDAKDM